MSGRTWMVERDGVELAVREIGDPDAPAMLIAHGVGSSARFIVDAFGAPVAAAGHRLVTYDLRGHSASTPVRDVSAHRLDEHVADLGRVADSVRPTVVGGVSLGGHAAAGWAAGRSDLDGLLVCLPAWIGGSASGDGPHAAIADEVRRTGTDAALRRAVADPVVPRWLRGLLRRDWGACDPASLAAALIALDGGRAPDRSHLRRITAPVGVVGWPDDPGHPLETARRWVEAVPRGALGEVRMSEVGADLTRLGRAALAALDAAR